MTRDEKSAVLRQHCALLMEMFDAVQIMASDYDPCAGDTAYFFEGRGNSLTRDGLARLFISDASVSSDGDVDGESWEGA